MNFERRQIIALFGSLFATSSARSLLAEDPQFVEPVHRVANAASIEPTPKPAASHPLDRALDIARNGLTGCRESVRDYTALLVKRERVDGTLGQHEFMEAKIRNRKVSGGKVVQPLSVYLNFVKPTSVKGREVIYVEGRNDGNIVAHEGGFKGRFLPTVTIPATGMLAMRGQRYPMTEIGVENLIEKLIERGTKARQQPDVQCEFRKNARVKDSVCTVLQVTSPTKVPGLDFYQAQVFIDDALNLPVRYIAYDWPVREGAPLEVIEEYNYLNLKVNVGLTDADFDPYNKQYNFYS
ncbi:hypothetical protein K227x_44150 [Rubripirellula lacrimiformis]|uniref:DUF1571 domain-containing protein n=1 Tax=Rubripirellula lacrimiformis TaxID=1930273 RepID=A0A517NG05_9BACT|nr:DUF1571 domain-containing protein [Rubripirellula lacrimiformis]QDT06008.1 hypothetical protein K227x_44150 [Rubripirellula lacrimiformis]